MSDLACLHHPLRSCEGSPYEGKAKGEWRTNPHVQSYALATDKVGGGLRECLPGAGTCTRCSEKKKQVRHWWGCSAVAEQEGSPEQAHAWNGGSRPAM